MQLNIGPSVNQHQFLLVRDLGERFCIMCARILLPFPLLEIKELFKRSLAVYIRFLKRTMVGMYHQSQKELLNKRLAKEARGSNI